MPFKFFRPWEDSRQDDTLQTPNPRHEASSRPSETTATHHALSVQVVHHGVPSEEATRSEKEEKKHRLEIGDVSNASHRVALSAKVSGLTLPVFYVFKGAFLETSLTRCIMKKTLGRIYSRFITDI